MAKPTTYKGSLVAVYLESPTTPGTYLKPCGLTEHTVSFTKNATEVNIPDCDNPELPQWVERDVESLDLSISGSGLLAAEAVQAWWKYFNDTDPVNCRVYIGAASDATNGYYWSGAFHITSFETGGTVGQKATASIGLASSGPIALYKRASPGPDTVVS